MMIVMIIKNMILITIIFRGILSLEFLFYYLLCFCFRLHSMDQFFLTFLFILILLGISRLQKNEKLNQLITLQADTKDDIAADKLIFDNNSGRFYESKIEEMCEEEFCLIDTDNGKNILLTREEKERIFLDSIQSYYFKGQNGLSDVQFDKLRSVKKIIILLHYFVFMFII